MKYKTISCISLMWLFVVFHACKNDTPTEARNQAPLISSVIAEPDSVSIHDTTLVTCTASDPDGDSLSFEWDLLNAGVFYATEQPNVIKFTTSVLDRQPHEVRVRCVVSDGNGGVTADTLLIKVYDPNRAPVISSLTAEPAMITAFNDSSIITCNATDPEGSELKFILRWSNDNAPIGMRAPIGLRVHADASHRATVYPLTGDTTTTVLCEVSDGGTGVTTRKVPITVSDFTSSLIPEKDRVRVGESTLITYSLQDTDGESPTGAEYFWQSVGAGDATIVRTEEPNVIEWSGDVPGDYQIRATVRGEFGVIDEKLLFMKVTE